MKFFYFILLSAFILISCGKEKSFEPGNGNNPGTTNCKNPYTGGCKLLTLIYEPAITGAGKSSVDFTYTGDVITQAEDETDIRKIAYNADKKINRIGYYDKTNNYKLYLEELFIYNNNKQISTHYVIELFGGVADTSYKIEFAYNTNKHLQTKLISNYSSSNTPAWTESERFDYEYNADGLVNNVKYYDLSAGSNAIPFPVSYTDSCNAFQQIQPQFELIDYLGQEDLGGLSVLYTAPKLANIANGSQIRYTFSNKNVPIEIYFDNQLAATYIYQCQ